MRLNKCLYQDMTVWVAENMDQAGWKGYCFGWIREAGEAKYLIQPLADASTPMLIPVNDIYLWPTAVQEGLPEGTEPTAVLINCAIAKRPS